MGLNETSTNSTYIGYNAYPLASGDTNETVIGNGAVGSGSNTVTLGGTGTTGTIIPYGNVGIGTTGPATALDVNGDITDRNVTSSPFLATNASGTIIFESSSTAASNLGLGTAAYTASSAYLPVAGTAANSTELNGQVASYYQTALGFTPAHSGANSDITSLSGLTTPLSAGQGGTATTTVLGTCAFLSFLRFGSFLLRRFRDNSKWSFRHRRDDNHFHGSDFLSRRDNAKHGKWACI